MHASLCYGGPVKSFSIAGEQGGTAGTVKAFKFLGVPVRLPISIQPSDLLHPSDGKLLALLGFANLLLAGFNLVPAFPMDGGRLLRALLSFIRPEDEATRIAAWMGRVVAFSLGLYGLVQGEF